MELTENEIKLVLEERTRERVAKAVQDVSEVLRRHNVRLVASFLLSEGGITPKIEIVPLEE